MWNRLKAILADFIQQADLVLLGLCCAATLYGMALIASATRYLNIGGIVRYVGVQGAAMVLGICAYIFMSMLDLERLMRRWKWLVAFNVVFIALLLTPFGVSDNTGNTAWLKFPFLPFSIGPAEVVKITFTLLLAKQLEWLREVKRDLNYAGSNGWTRVDADLTMNGTCHERDGFRRSYLQYGSPGWSPDDKDTEPFAPVNMKGRVYGKYFKEWDTGIFFYVMAADEMVLENCDRDILSRSSVR